MSSSEIVLDGSTSASTRTSMSPSSKASSRIHASAATSRPKRGYAIRSDPALGLQSHPRLGHGQERSEALAPGHIARERLASNRHAIDGGAHRRRIQKQREHLVAT